MKNYIIHIGLPKTGTTALQSAYFNHFKKSEICYNPPWIVQSLSEILKLIDFEMEKKSDLQLLKDFVSSEEQKIPQNNILISLEILSQRLGKFDYRKRGEFLKSIFPDATIVLVLRYQPNLLQSLYLQFLRQNYLLKYDEVFVPFTKSTFLNTEQWKANMLIDIKQWNYTEAVSHFQRLYGENFHVYFYEKFPNLIDLGKEIVALANIDVNDATINSLPKVNIAYNAKIVDQLLFISRLGLAFRSNRGMNSRHINDLITQAKQARFIFQAEEEGDFLFRLKKSRHISQNIYSSLDAMLLKALMRIQSMSVLNQAAYKLPSFLMRQLEYEAKAMNKSLHKVIHNQSIPEQYIYP